MLPLNEYYTCNDIKLIILRHFNNQNEYIWLLICRINRLCFGVFGSYKRVNDDTKSMKTGFKN
jgi:hypothetical protein